MKVIAVLICISLVLAGTFLGLFVWAVKKGQFDDLESPGFRIIRDEKLNTKSNKKLNN